ncbi:MAG: NfeD family protein, partial [Planctomycetota bacterium]
GGFIEYVSPGLILPGTLAGIALVLLIGAPYVVGLASIWHIVVVVLGLMILIFELVTLSTGGILVVVGLVMILVGLALAAVQSGPNGLPAAGTANQLLVSALSMGGGLIIAVPAFIVIVRYFGELPGLKRLVLEDVPTAQAFNSAGEPIDAPEQRVSGDESVGAGWVQVGMTGTVTSTGLRPTGRVEIDDKLIDVTSTGGWVEAGTSVTVIEVQGNVVTVEAVGDV